MFSIVAQTEMALILSQPLLVREDVLAWYYLDRLAICINHLCLSILLLLWLLLLL